MTDPRRLIEVLVEGGVELILFGDAAAIEPPGTLFRLRSRDILPAKRPSPPSRRCGPRSWCTS
ncbi:hypothetical protein BE17_48070 [Sorangium cellulosum]|uniref:Uncharacterized protein n=1 Tax=Sorangium cellulosum TaxID=56 RepID=A0A150RQM5_SORCE|nr:hypothetical protein BE17_48070 [Sorangium cellulosum]